MEERHQKPHRDRSVRDVREDAFIGLAFVGNAVLLGGIRVDRQHEPQEPIDGVCGVCMRSDQNVAKKRHLEFGRTGTALRLGTIAE